jgi:CO/xanthine dehydrogenase Mo-binding subunit
MENSIGKSVIRKEAWDKVTGKAQYTDDLLPQDILHAKILTSPHTHAIIRSIDVNKAQKAPGVRAVITGEYYPALVGTIINDRPPIAHDRVRYFGEPVALVVARSEMEAMAATKLIKVDYDLLPIINEVGDAVKPGALKIHEKLMQYRQMDDDVHPETGTNVVDRIKIRKGDMNKGWAESEVVVEGHFTLPQADHIAMETRNARCEILPDGRVFIYSSTQAPFTIKKIISQTYNIPEGKVIVKVPFVGGGFGGKAPVTIELLAYLASKAVGGKLVRIAATREEDIRTFPVKMGLDATLKLGATKDGFIKAMECTYLVDTGAYADIGPRLAKAIAVDCSGPYNIANISCDSLCVYTNHTFATSFRGFSHSCYTFCIERMVEKLAYALRMDSMDLRMKNAIREGGTSPTQVRASKSNVGNMTLCLEKLQDIMKWKDGVRFEANGKIYAKGIASLWKTSDSPTDAISGVTLTFNSDGSINMNCGAVEIGPGTKTTACQILAGEMQMDYDRIFIQMGVDTEVSPNHWKTVASMTSFMLGRAIVRAAKDLKRQIKELGATVLKCHPEDLVVANEKVYIEDLPDKFLTFDELCHGYKYDNGMTIEGQLIGRGSYVMRHLTPLDPKTGEGKPGPYWTVGAQGVEIEYDPNLYTYRLVKAISVIDAGRVINPKMAAGVIMGGMSMGLGMATREELKHDADGKIEDTSLRTYKVMHFGQNPEYIVDFVEEPNFVSPFGLRGIGEHGIIGMPAAFVNALCTATGHDFLTVPINPEQIWKALTGGKR